MRRVLTLLLLIVAVCRADAAGQASHVVVVVWDGMRPDFVREELTPNLCGLAREGTTFANHHAVYPSSTEVNGTAIATGCYPGVSSIVANKEFLPAVNPTNSVEVEAQTTVRKGDKATGGHYLQVPTLAETLRQNGKRTIVIGSKTVALLHDRAERTNDAQGVNVFEGASVPETVLARLTNELGSFPVAISNRSNRDIWSTTALAGPLWGAEVPEFSLLWLGDPDGAQHNSAPGSSLSVNSIRNSDAMLGRVLDELTRRNLRDKTDVIVLSDHGFSTVTTNTDIVALLKTNGFSAFRQFPPSGPKENDILVIGGCSALLYFTGHNPELIERVVHYLQTQPFTGVIFTKNPVPGAFLLSDVKLDCPAAPDVMVSMRWRADKNTNGTPGVIWSDYGNFKAVHVGAHGSLSRCEMHNICFAAGPDFRRGITDPLPSGNVDIAPTILWVLGVAPGQPVSGRILTEALTIAGPKLESVQPNRLESEFKGQGFIWRQWVRYCEVNGTIYFDEGNGAQAPLGPEKQATH